ncbi:MAG: putative signal transducing protein, partial [Burkholderiaceae bacterium]
CTTGNNARINMATDTKDKPAMSEQDTSARDLFVVAKYYIPTDAHIVRGCLVAAGVPAAIVDDNLVQTNSLLTAAVGGVRILVPESYLQQAREIIEAFNRGDFQLKDDEDVGES